MYYDARHQLITDFKGVGYIELSQSVQFKSVPPPNFHKKITKKAAASQSIKDYLKRPPSGQRTSVSPVKSKHKASKKPVGKSEPAKKKFVED